MRHIDADAITPDIVQSYTSNADVYLVIRKILDDAPTVDVVSRAEEKAWVACCRKWQDRAVKAEELQIELEAMRCAANSYKMSYERLAREIFEEFEALFPSDRKFTTISRLTLERLKKKYTEGKQ